jgi:hypothetical protein
MSEWRCVGDRLEAPSGLGVSFKTIWPCRLGLTCAVSCERRGACLGSATCGYPPCVFHSKAEVYRRPCAAAACPAVEYLRRSAYVAQVRRCQPLSLRSTSAARGPKCRPARYIWPCGTWEGTRRRLDPADSPLLRRVLTSSAETPTDDLRTWCQVAGSSVLASEVEAASFQWRSIGGAFAG